MNQKKIKKNSFFHCSKGLLQRPIHPKLMPEENIPGSAQYLISFLSCLHVLLFPTAKNLNVDTWSGLDDKPVACKSLLATYLDKKLNGLILFSTLVN